MSPYMRAYEAGIKLAQLGWMSKVADGPENMSLEEEPNMSQPAETSTEPEVPATTDYSFGLGEYLSDLYQGSPIPEYVNTATEVYQGSPIPEYVNTATEAYQGSALQGYTNKAYNMANNFFQGTDPGTSSSQQAPTQAAPASQMADPTNEGRAPRKLRFGAELVGDNPQARSAAQQPAAQQPAAQQPAAQQPAAQQPAAQQPAAQQPAAQQPAAAQGQQAPQFDYQAVNREGMVDQDARFNVQAGNYRKQFNRFREQFGGGQDDAFKGLTYRDFAGALGNRGLRVGDNLNASDIMSRLQGIRRDNYNREQGMPVASSGAGLDPLGIQNRRGNVVSRGSLAAQRAAAQRARTNMPQARPGQFANTQLSSPGGQAPSKAPQLTLGSNRPGIGSGGFQSPVSAAKATPSGLNIGGDFRLNTSRSPRPFNEYED